MTLSPARRRVVIVVVAVAVAVVLLLVLLFATTGDDSGDGNRPTTTTSGTTAGSGRSSSSVRLPDPARVIEGSLSGARVRLALQPLVRTGSSTVLTAVLTVVEAPERGSFSIGDSFTARGEGGNLSYDLSDVRLFAADQGVLASPATGANGKAATSSLGNEPGLKRGDSAGLRVAFGAMPPAAQRADVLWPHLGVVPDVPIKEGAVPELPSFGELPARDVELAGVSGKVQPVTARSSELEGTVKTEQAPERTKVVLASDVLFALDSADLSAEAKVALDRGAAQIEAAGPGPVKVTGHTDDQGTDQYNLDLSNRRAQAVAAALRLPPEQYPREVSGRGESEPAVKGTAPDARAANRRVELLVERRQRAAPVPAPAAPPPGGGPTAKGTEGLVFEQSDGSQLRLRAERAVRQGSWLRVDLTATVERNDKDGTTDFLVDLRDASRRPFLRADASGVGVLDGSLLRLPAVDPDGDFCACANTLFGVSILGLEERRLSVWVGAPAAAGAVVVQLPRGQGRLLDVPVAAR